MNITITSRGVSVTVDTSKLSAEIKDRLFVHGLIQKVSDAASGAKGLAAETGASVGDITLTMMQKAADSLLAGEWAMRTAGEGVSEETKVQRSIMRTKVKAKYGAKSPEWAKFTGLTDAEQNAELDRWFAKNAAKLEDEVKAELKRREEARKAKAKLAASTDIDL